MQCPMPLRHLISNETKYHSHSQQAIPVCTSPCLLKQRHNIPRPTSSLNPKSQPQKSSSAQRPRANDDYQLSLALSRGAAPINRISSHYESYLLVARCQHANARRCERKERGDARCRGRCSCWPPFARRRASY